MSEAFAWAAGFVDADGSITIARNFGPGSGRGYRLKLSVTQVDPAPLFRLQSLFGGVVRLRSRPTRANQRTQNEWTVGSRDALRVLRLIEPYMVGKREQARLAMWFQQSKVRPGAKPTLCHIAEEEAFHDAMKDSHKWTYDEVAA